MNYINTITSQYPISEQDIRNQNPNTSFSYPFVAPSEYALVFSSPQPEFNQVTQTAREVQPELTSKGNYEQRWEVVSKFVEYTDEQGVIHTVVEQEQEAILADQQAKDVAAREEAKRKRAEAVANIKVTTSAGNTFDGDEESQTRMSRAITALSPAETITWVLSDNTPTLVSREELQEALRLAGAAQTAIWGKPYVETATQD